MSGDISMEVIDARSALGVIVLQETEDGQIVSDIKGLKLDKLTTAKLLYQMAKRLKALHDAEQESADPVPPSLP